MTSLLESYYGAEGVEALEKTAQAKFIEKLAADYGEDISALGPEQRQEFESLVLGDLQSAGLVEGTQEEKTAAEPFEGDDDVEVGEDGKTHEDIARDMANAFADEIEKRAAAKEKTAGDLNSVPIPSTGTPGQTPSWLSSLWNKAEELTHEGTGLPKLDKLAEARAVDMLKAAADVLEQDTDPLDDAVTLRSLEMMDDAGYDSDLVTEKVAQALEAAEMEKQAEDKKNTYPVSRFMTNPMTHAGVGGTGGALAGGTVGGILGGGPAGGIKGKILGALLGGTLGGAGGAALLGGSSALTRGAFLRALRGRANTGQAGSSESEKKLLKALRGQQV